EDIQQDKPLIKFIAIKAIVFVTFWEAFIISWLGSNNIHVIKGTKYWSKDNVVEGLTALIICIEMVLFGLLFIKAFPVEPYRRPDGVGRTSTKRAFIDSLNFMDFIYEIWYELRWMAAPLTGRYPAEPDAEKGRFGRMDINGAVRYKINKQTYEQLGASQDPKYSEDLAMREMSPIANPDEIVSHDISMGTHNSAAMHLRTDPDLYSRSTLSSSPHAPAVPTQIHVVPQGHYSPPPGAAPQSSSNNSNPFYQ
ncbi:hypothetical protein FBU59_005773, partial [Linderina macrospora]